MLYTSLTDHELWNAVRQNDELAFTALFDRYWVRLYKLAKSYLKNQEISEELVHDIFLNIWNRRQTLEIDSFQTFMLTAARYQVYNRMRAAKPPRLILGDTHPVNEPFQNNEGEDHLIEQELQLQLQQYLVQLPKRCQEIFYLSRVKNLSNQEIADSFGVSKRTVENQITLALKHLRSCMKYTTTAAIFFRLLLFRH
ncbi:RNA polymerase sigma-70 factor [Mucilaginibacter sp. SMC90]|uniref:RNA polymerase sigma factor n=1 Tax=Mucilaginibacter sp. SMC90 TaxID=2929803 RepID=UPI001FB3CBA7|nr:RNA polymerase sigma-70 factor [Mucilaginibacter sp. SMC90]UOE47212.1 RNA polymerase sigma-70 factor [Mucilaginibacter sp. SMC90]